MGQEINEKIKKNNNWYNSIFLSDHPDHNWKIWNGPLLQEKIF